MQRIAMTEALQQHSLEPEGVGDYRAVPIKQQHALFTRPLVVQRNAYRLSRAATSAAGLMVHPSKDKA